jgi:hypothetical protein
MRSKLRARNSKFRARDPKFRQIHPKNGKQSSVIGWLLSTGEPQQRASARPARSPGCPAAEELFEDTAAFAWLNAHAADHGYTLSFPRDNPEGYIYEPWHWCFERDRLLA